MKRWKSERVERWRIGGIEILENKRDGNEMINEEKIKELMKGPRSGKMKNERMKERRKDRREE